VFYSRAERVRQVRKNKIKIKREREREREGTVSDNTEKMLKQAEGASGAEGSC